jgi:putative endonuclease
MAYFVYVIKSETTGGIYIGQTNDINRRLEEHNNPLRGKKRKYTKKRGPWKLVYFEDFSTREESIIRERTLKNHKGRDWIKLYLLRGSQA